MAGPVKEYVEKSEALQFMAREMGGPRKDMEADLEARRTEIANWNRETGKTPHPGRDPYAQAAMEIVEDYHAGLSKKQLLEVSPTAQHYRDVGYSVMKSDLDSKFAEVHPAPHVQQQRVHDLAVTASQAVEQGLRPVGAVDPPDAYRAVYETGMRQSIKDWSHNQNHRLSSQIDEHRKASEETLRLLESKREAVVTNDWKTESWTPEARGRYIASAAEVFPGVYSANLREEQSVKVFDHAIAGMKTELAQQTPKPQAVAQLSNVEIEKEFRALHSHFRELSERYQQAPASQRTELREEMRPVVNRERELRQEYAGRATQELRQDRVPELELSYSR